MSSLTNLLYLDSDTRKQNIGALLVERHFCLYKSTGRSENSLYKSVQIINHLLMQFLP